MGERKQRWKTDGRSTDPVRMNRNERDLHDTCQYDTSCLVLSTEEAWKQQSRSREPRLV